MDVCMFSHYGLASVVLLGLCCGACRAAEDAAARDDERQADRRRMIETLRAHGVRDPAVLTAMGRIRRHRFIPEPHRGQVDAYGDHPAPIGWDQTISQPFIVAYMTAAMNVQAGEKVLEVGTGSGYQAAVLAELGAAVYSIEIIPELADHARSALASEGYGDVNVRTGDGYLGWPEAAPFDVILVTCAPDAIPGPLKAQLAEGGRMIIPVGVDTQRLVILRKQDGEIRQSDDLPVRFVPMLRAADRP